MRTSLVAQSVKKLPAMQETQILSLGQEEPLEEGKAAHSSILPWRPPWQRSLVGYSPWGHKDLRNMWSCEAWATTCHVAWRAEDGGGRKDKVHVQREAGGQGMQEETERERAPEMGASPGFRQYPCRCSLLLQRTRLLGPSRWLSGKESAHQCRRHGFDLWSGKQASARRSLGTAAIEPVLQNPGLNPAPQLLEPASPRPRRGHGRPPQREPWAPRWRGAPAGHSWRKPVEGSKDPAQPKINT